MKTNDRILAPARSTAAAAVAYAQANGAKQFDEVQRYIAELYRLAPIVGIDPAILFAQAVHETGNFQSSWWVDRLNPAGIGITGDPNQNNASKTWTTGTEAARAHVAHMLVYTLGPVDASKRWGEVFGPFGDQISTVDPRYSAYVEAFGNTVQARTIDDLTGKWGVDTRYAAKLVERGNAIFPGLNNQTDDDTGGTYTKANTLIIIDAGHRSTDRSGNPAEMDRTDDMAEAYAVACRSAGWQAINVKLVQRDLDGDSDARWTAGNLNTVTLIVRNYIRAVLRDRPDIKLIVFVSCHFNGSSSPWHVIVANNIGLTTAYSGGAPADDTAANNSLDVAFAKTLAANQARALGNYPLYAGTIAKGVMGENQSGVGLQGYRLALFAGTSERAIRMASIRAIIEHGGTAAGVAQRDDFESICADTFVDTIEQLLITDPIPEPDPPAPPKPNVVKPTRPYLGRFVNGDEIAPTGGPRGLAMRFKHRTETRDLPDPKALVVSTVEPNTSTTTAYYVVGTDGNLWVWLASGTYVPYRTFIGTVPTTPSGAKAFAAAEADGDAWSNLDLSGPVDAAGNPITGQMRAAALTGDTSCSTDIPDDLITFEVDDDE